MNIGRFLLPLAVTASVMFVARASAGGSDASADDAGQSSFDASPDVEDAGDVDACAQAPCLCHFPPPCGIDDGSPAGNDAATAAGCSCENSGSGRFPSFGWVFFVFSFLVIRGLLVKRRPPRPRR